MRDELKLTNLALSPERAKDMKAIKDSINLRNEADNSSKNNLSANYSQSIKKDQSVGLDEF